MVLPLLPEGNERVCLLRGVAAGVSRCSRSTAASDQVRADRGTDRQGNDRRQPRRANHSGRLLPDSHPGITSSWLSVLVVTAGRLPPAGICGATSVAMD